MVKCKENYINKKFGHLVIIKQTEDYIEPNGKHQAKFLCECDCNTKYPNRFCNEYSLFFVENKEEADMLMLKNLEKRIEGEGNKYIENITLKKMKKMISVEKRGRKEDPMFYGYATTEAIPIKDILDI